MRRLLLLVSAIVFADTMFYAAITPLLPHYAATLHLSKSGAGLLSASYAAGTLLAALPAGWLAARMGVRPTVLAGLTLFSVTSVIFAFAHSVAVLDAARFAEGVGGAASWAAGLAWLVARAPDDRRGALIGTALSAAIGGVLLGPVLGTLASALGPEAVFSAVAVIGVGLAAAAAVTEAPPPSAPEPLRDVGAALVRPRVAGGAWLVMVPSLTFGLVNVLVPLRLHDLGASALAIGAVFLVSAAIESLVSAYAGRVADRRGRRLPIRAGLALCAVFTGLLALPPALGPLVVFTVGFGASAGLLWAPAMALLSDDAAAAGLAQGYAFGLVNLAWASGQVLGGAAGSSVAKAVGDALPFLVLAAVTAATLAALQRQGAKRFLAARATGRGSFSSARRP